MQRVHGHAGCFDAAPFYSSFLGPAYSYVMKKKKCPITEHHPPDTALNAGPQYGVSIELQDAPKPRQRFLIREVDCRASLEILFRCLRVRKLHRGLGEFETRVDEVT